MKKTNDNTFEADFSESEEQVTLAVKANFDLKITLTLSKDIPFTKPKVTSI